MTTMTGTASAPCTDAPGTDVPTGTRVCTLDDLEVERGRAALIDGEQVAIFLLQGGEVRAVDNLDPYSGAHVMSRGIVGSRGDVPTVASPLHKQVFDLRSGRCLDTQGKPDAALRVWPVGVQDGAVFIASPERFIASPGSADA